MTRYMAGLEPALRKAVSAEIQSGEKVLYAAMPDWRAEWPKLLLIFAFAIGWSSICGPMAVLVWGEALGLGPVPRGQGMGSGLAIFFSVFMVPFVLIGVGLLAAPFLAITKSRRTAHVVTDRRLVNVTAGKRSEVESFKLDTINVVKRRMGRNGYGTLTIGYGVEKDSDGDTRPLTTEWSGVPDAHEAERLIREHARWVR